MKAIEKYEDEISGKVFDTAEKAIVSEKENGGINKLFSFWKRRPEDKHCKFVNGDGCYQRTEGDVLQFKEALLKALKDYEPWITKQYDSDGGLRIEHLGGGFIIGRYLCDGNSELYHYYCLLSCICPKCFREWGQQYYANNCKCNETPKELR